jgi:ERCC4-type nuclease
MNNELIILCDTREQMPFFFRNLPIRGYKQIKTEVATLKTGDYSIKGLEDIFIIERKSVGDLCGTLTGGHERFMREMERMEKFKMKYIIIEGSAIDIIKHCQQYGMLNAVNTIFQTLIAYSYHYKIRIKLCKNRKDATEYAARKIIEFWREQNELKSNKSESI